MEGEVCVVLELVEEGVRAKYGNEMEAWVCVLMS